MNKIKIKKGDQVLVIAGENKGAKGTVLKILYNSNKAIVEGVNTVKRHTKPNPNLGQPGGIVEKEAAVHISNVAIFNPETNAADRVKIQVDENGVKTRVFSSNDQSID